jgi:hypothetical protein
VKDEVSDSLDGLLTFCKAVLFTAYSTGVYGVPGIEMPGEEVP